MMKLDLGCGCHAPQDWVNVDYAIGAKIAKIPLLRKISFTRLKWDDNIYLHNLTSPFPWETNSVDYIYSSHTLEHFTREDGYEFLKECYRILKPGVIIRIVVPDLKHFVNKYISGEMRADYFIDELLVLHPAHNNLFKKILIPFISFPHKCMYDTETLLSILKNIGFEVETKKAFESEMIDIKTIELKDRTVSSVIVEGNKK